MICRTFICHIPRNVSTRRQVPAHAGRLPHWGEQGRRCRVRPAQTSWAAAVCRHTPPPRAGFQGCWRRWLGPPCPLLSGAKLAPVTREQTLPCLCLYDVVALARGPPRGSPRLSLRLPGSSTSRSLPRPPTSPFRQSQHFST